MKNLDCLRFLAVSLRSLALLILLLSISTNTFAAAMAGDFDGDGITDLSHRGLNIDSSYTWQYESTVNPFQLFNVLNIDNLGAKMAPADFDGDGKIEACGWTPGTGVWRMRQSTNNQYRNFTFGTNGDIPVPADFDGDGKADFVVFRPSNGLWYIAYSNPASGTGGYGVFQWGMNGDHPLPADYDGDGKADLAVVRRDAVAGASQWWILRSSDNVMLYTVFGYDTDIPTTGDFNGGGAMDIAVWRRANGVWYVLQVEDSSIKFIPPACITSGPPTRILPVAGDYDGDGKYDGFVYIQEGIGEARWCGIKSNGNQYFIDNFGGMDGYPVPGAYLPQ